MINISYRKVLNDLKKKFSDLNKDGADKLKELEDQRVIPTQEPWDIDRYCLIPETFQLANIGKLKPTLGHPNNLTILNELDAKEKERQKISGNVIEESTVSMRVSNRGFHITVLFKLQFLSNFKEVIKEYAKVFQESLIKHHEHLLLKFDDILTIDDVHKHGKIFFREKYFQVGFWKMLTV